MSVLEVVDLNKKFNVNFRETHVLKWVNLSINEWELYWFLWPNGSWKTTTLKCILNFIRPTSGEIKIFGEDLSRNPSILKKIGYAPEQAYYYDHLTWIEFAVFMWQLSGMHEAVATKKWTKLLENIWLGFAKDRYIKSYSKGMKQRLWLVSAIINDPQLIFFDEPMSWLDPLGRSLVKQLMLDLKNQWKTIFINTHILADVQEIADRFGIIHDWKVIFEDKVKNVQWSLENFFIAKITEQTSNMQIR